MAWRPSLGAEVSDRWDYSSDDDDFLWAETSHGGWSAGLPGQKQYGWATGENWRREQWRKLVSCAHPFPAGVGG